MGNLTVEEGAVDTVADAAMHEHAAPEQAAAEEGAEHHAGRLRVKAKQNAERRIDQHSEGGERIHRHHDEGDVRVLAGIIRHDANVVGVRVRARATASAPVPAPGTA